MACIASFNDVQQVMSHLSNTFIKLVQVQGYARGQEEVAKLGAIPKMLVLLKSTSETVKERTTEALLVWLLPRLSCASISQHVGTDEFEVVPSNITDPSWS